MEVPIMGLIKAITGAAGGILADQWKEFFYCNSIDAETLVVKGSKRISSKRSSNTKASDNIISDGSGIAVADGQCMLIVEQGKIVEVCAEPGEYTFDKSTEPSIFTGSLSDGIRKTFETIGKRFTYGGDTGKDQRVYYVNTKEIIGNKFGTAMPIPFRVVDRNIGLDIDVSVRCNGIYSYKITDPVLFYTNVCGNVEGSYEREEIESQLKAEFIGALQPAFAKISDLEIRPNALPAHVDELSKAMNATLTEKWAELRGISVVSIGLNSVTLPEEDADMIKQAQKAAILRDPSMAAATIASAQADAMKTAAGNEGGAMTGFMGMGMATNAGGMNVNGLFEMAEEKKKQQMEEMKKFAENNNSTSVNEVAGEWTCSCGAKNTGKFCSECGAKKPEDGWVCECGTVNKGKFCTNCGKKKPAGMPLYRCDKCGWEPEDPHNPPKFCPECGDRFDENDIKND